MRVFSGSGRQCDHEHAWRGTQTEGKGELKKGREYHCKEENQKTITVVEETRNENENLNFWDWYKSLVE